MKNKLIPDIIFLVFFLLIIFSGIVLSQNRDLRSKLNKEILLKERIESEKLQLLKKKKIQNIELIANKDTDKVEDAIKKNSDISICKKLNIDLNNEIKNLRIENRSLQLQNNELSKKLIQAQRQNRK